MTTLDTIRAACVEIDGEPHVRACTLCRLLGVGRWTVETWQKQGLVAPVVAPVPVSRRDSRGFGVFYPLSQVPVVLARQEARRSIFWTEEQDRQLLKLVGLYSLAEVARRIDRTESAINLRLWRLGTGSRASLTKHHGLISSGKLGKILGRRVCTINRWVREEGCPARRLGMGQSEYGFNLREVRAWLMTRWETCLTLRPEVLALLRLKLEDGRVIDLQQTKGAA